MGIDLVIEDKNGFFSAVQCKYKKHLSYKKNVVSWKTLSTFYSLCMRSGPWNKYIVITNCDYVRHVGKKTSKDMSLCIGSFRKITKEEWTKMCQISGETVSTKNEPEPKLSKEDIIKKRLLFYSKT